MSVLLAAMLTGISPTKAGAAYASTTAGTWTTPVVVPTPIHAKAGRTVAVGQPLKQVAKTIAKPETLTNAKRVELPAQPENRALSVGAMAKQGRDASVSTSKLTSTRSFR